MFYSIFMILVVLVCKMVFLCFEARIKIIIILKQMSDSQETQRFFLKPQNDPEKNQQPIFYKTRFISSKDRKIKRSFNESQTAFIKDKNNFIAKDEAFRKTSSCISNSQKYDLTGDFLDFNSYDLRKQSRQSHKRIKPSKSVQNKIILMNEQQQNLFKKMTIHCVRAQRQIYQNNCKQLQRQFNYALNKINKQRKARFFSEMKVKKLEKMKEQRRKFSQDLQKERKFSLQRQQNYYKHAKNAILIQRENTQFSVGRKLKQNKLSASQQRLNQCQIHCQMQVKFLEDFKKKRELYQKQKQAEQQRKHNIIRNRQLKKLQAKKQFRNKWLTQLEKSNIAREKFKQKKEKLENSLKRALQNYIFKGKHHDQ